MSQASGYIELKYESDFISEKFKRPILFICSYESEALLNKSYNFLLSWITAGKRFAGITRLSEILHKTISSKFKMRFTRKWLA